MRRDIDENQEAGMRISELIEFLQGKMAEHGDCEVRCFQSEGGNSLRGDVVGMGKESISFDLKRASIVIG